MSDFSKLYFLYSKLFVRLNYLINFLRFRQHVSDPKYTVEIDYDVPQYKGFRKYFNYHTSTGRRTVIIF